MITTISQLGFKLEHYESKPSGEELRNLVKEMAKDVPAQYQSKIVDHVVWFVEDFGIPESLAGRSVEERRVHFNGKDEWVPEIKIDDLRKDRSCRLVVNLKDSEVLVDTDGTKEMSDQQLGVLAKFCERYPERLKAEHFRSVWGNDQPADIKKSVSRAINKIRKKHDLLEEWVVTPSKRLGFYRISAEAEKMLLITKQTRCVQEIKTTKR